MSGELAGRLRERIAIVRREPIRDAGGGASEGWATIGPAWAAIEPDGSGDLTAGDARAASPRWRVTLRLGADVTVGDRLTWGQRRMRVRRRIDDPATPDRFTLHAEEER